MLVLSRRKNESIAIADGTIWVTVVEIRGDRVRIGIQAAREITVHRREVHEAIEEAKARQALEDNTQPKPEGGDNETNPEASDEAL